VLQLALEQGRLPWIALVLAFSFGLYGLVRKTAPVTPRVGFALEGLVLCPLALVYLLHLGAEGVNTVPLDAAGANLLIAGSGAITAGPLLFFNAAAKRLPLATLGFFQYVAPSLTFALAVVVYGEPFTRVDAVTFGCVWTALAIFSLDSLRASRGVG
jgi:chloramphenicol-sensitive protein RarD